MTCNEMFYAGIDNIKNAYKQVCVYNKEFREDFEKCRAENVKLRELIAQYSAAAKYLCKFSHCNECNLDCASVFDDMPSGWDCARMLLDKKARKLGVEIGQ